jgi:hypothetical protein
VTLTLPENFSSRSATVNPSRPLNLNPPQLVLLFRPALPKMQAQSASPAASG